MSLSLTFHVMGSTDLTRDGAYGLHVLRLRCNFDNVVEQFIGEKAIVKSSSCPRGFSLDTGDDEHEAITEDVDGALRYTYADELCKVVLPGSAHPLDFAVLGYFQALAQDAGGRNLPVVIVHS